jgi:hypothetical protein
MSSFNHSGYITNLSEECDLLKAAALRYRTFSEIDAITSTDTAKAIAHWERQTRSHPSTRKGDRTLGKIEAITLWEG